MLTCMQPLHCSLINHNTHLWEAAHVFPQLHHRVEPPLLLLVEALELLNLAGVTHGLELRVGV